MSDLCSGDRGSRDYGRYGSGGYDSRRGYGGGGGYNRDRDSGYSRGMSLLLKLNIQRNIYT